MAFLVINKIADYLLPPLIPHHRHLFLLLPSLGFPGEPLGRIRNATDALRHCNSKSRNCSSSGSRSMRKREQKEVETGGW
eukprot:gene2466-biopygen6472